MCSVSLSNELVSLKNIATMLCLKNTIKLILLLPYQNGTLQKATCRCSRSVQIKMTDKIVKSYPPLYAKMKFNSSVISATKSINVTIKTDIHFIFFKLRFLFYLKAVICKQSIRCNVILRNFRSYLNAPVIAYKSNN